VARTVRIPDPVYDAVSREANRKDISRGAVVREWKNKADKYDELEDRRR